MDKPINYSGTLKIKEFGTTKGYITILCTACAYKSNRNWIKDK